MGLYTVRVVMGMFLASLALCTACESSKKEPAAKAKSGAEEKKADGKPAAAKADEKAAPAADGELTHDTLLKQEEELEGKEVTVKAFSWGTSNLVGGKKRLSLGPAKLKGMRQAHLVADFEEGDTSVDAVKKDDEVKLKCTVGKKAHGARQLEKCKIL